MLDKLNVFPSLFNHFNISSSPTEHKSVIPTSLGSTPNLLYKYFIESKLIFSREHKLISSREHKLSATFAQENT